MPDEKGTLNDNNSDDDETEAFKALSAEGLPTTSRVNGGDDVFPESNYKLTARWTFYNRGLCYVLGFRILLWT